MLHSKKTWLETYDELIDCGLSIVAFCAQRNGRDHALKRAELERRLKVASSPSQDWPSILRFVMGADNIPAVDHQKAELFPTERTAAIELFANNFNNVFHNDWLAARIAGPRAVVHLLNTCALQVVPKEFIRRSRHT